MLHSDAISPDSASPGLTWVSLATVGAGLAAGASGVAATSGVVLTATGLSLLQPIAAMRTRMRVVVFMPRILPYKSAPSRDLVPPAALDPSCHDSTEPHPPGLRRRRARARRLRQKARRSDKDQGGRRRSRRRTDRDAGARRRPDQALQLHLRGRRA